MLWLKYSWVFSLPKSSRGSAHNKSHMGPKAGGSLNRSNLTQEHRQAGLKKNTHTQKKSQCRLDLVVPEQRVATFLMSSKVCISGESPPWTHRNCWFMSAARGRQSNASIHESYTCSEYLILPGGRETCNELHQGSHRYVCT